MLPKLQEMDSQTVSDLISKIDKAIREMNDIEPVLDEVDLKVLHEFIGIDKETIRKFRAIWKKLMSRRLNRKKKKRYI
ncbi:hypothetical protein D3C76_1488370 [compost metagenome]